MRVGARAFGAELASRLYHGEHLLLYGPRGSGKSTLLRNLERHIERSGIPCAYMGKTESLDAITRTLAKAYPEVDTDGLPRRRARARLRLAAEARRGVLLLDHAGRVNTQMVGLLRRLRGGVAGVLIGADVDTGGERQRMRDWHLGTSTLRMPPASTAQLRRLFRDGCREAGRLDRMTPWEREILHAADGRIGWIVQCLRLIGEPRYWNGATLYATLLCTDTDLMLRDPELATNVLGDRNAPIPAIDE